MTLLLRSLIAFPFVAVLCSNTLPGAKAAPTRALDAASETAIGGIGFLDFKTFLIAPSGLDDPALASERMRIIAPESMLYEQARGGMTVTPSGFPDLPSTVRAKRHRIDPDIDTLMIELNGTPVKLNLGLRDAMRRDLEESIRLFGVSGLFDPIPGIATVGLLGNAVRDIVQGIETLENGAAGGDAYMFGTPRAVSGPSGIPEPSSLSLFAFGLLVMSWLRRAWPTRKEGR